MLDVRVLWIVSLAVQDCYSLKWEIRVLRAEMKQVRRKSGENVKASGAGELDVPDKEEITKYRVETSENAR